jgi:hypothetical protein
LPSEMSGGARLAGIEIRAAEGRTTRALMLLPRGRQAARISPTAESRHGRSPHRPPSHSRPSRAAPRPLLWVHCNPHGPAHIPCSSSRSLAIRTAHQLQAVETCQPLIRLVPPVASSPDLAPSASPTILCIDPSASPPGAPSLPIQALPTTIGRYICQP